MSLSIHKESVVRYFLCLGVSVTFWYLLKEPWQAVCLFLLYVTLTRLHEDLADIHQLMKCKQGEIRSHVFNHTASLIGSAISFFVFEKIAYGLAVWLLLVLLTSTFSLKRDIRRHLLLVYETRPGKFYSMIWYAPSQS